MPPGVLPDQGFLEFSLIVFARPAHTSEPQLFP